MNVNGGGLYQVNHPLIIKGNLAITGSAGIPGLGWNAFNGAYGSHGHTGPEVWGNFSYTGNSAPLYIGGTTGLLVKGNFNHSDNTSAPSIDTTVFKVTGNSTIS